jgi:hypothetical protein
MSAFSQLHHQPFHLCPTGCSIYSGADPVSSTMGTKDLFTGIERPGREADHLPPSSAEVKKGGAISPLPETSSWRGAS